jgi:hypothetical protein
MGVMKLAAMNTVTRSVAVRKLKGFLQPLVGTEPKHFQGGTLGQARYDLLSAGYRKVKGVQIHSELFRKTTGDLEITVEVIC